jgi:glycosyltransferase involved in cell wall biosynthesis
VKVGIDIRVRPGLAGGVATAVRSLVSALGEQEDGPEQYTMIVGSNEQVEWLSPLAANQRFVMRPAEARHPLLRPVWPVVRRIQHLLSPPRHWPEVPISDGFYESLGCNLIHFPTQSFTACAVRSVYNPIDLQHLHYPEFFDAWTIAWRETVYRAGCDLAQALIVNSEWIKTSVVRHYRVDPTKILVVAEAPPPAAGSGVDPGDERLAMVGAKYDLADRFVLYPAVTWPHKNHLRLFEALEILRTTRGLRLQLICTGSRFEQHWADIEHGLHKSGLTSQVRFLGHVPDDDLRCLFKLATCLALPSLYEANSLPIFEAWREGTPVACSNATGLPEQVADAALIFDPTDPHAIADALATLAINADLRAGLRNRGRRRVQQFSWRQTARAYRAIYRKVADQPLTEEDRSLLRLADRPSTATSPTAGAVFGGVSGAHRL